MRILATGSAGHLGEALMRTLEHSDHVYIAVYPIGHTSTNTRDLDWDGNAARLQQQHPTTAQIRGFAQSFGTGRRL